MKTQLLRFPNPSSGPTPSEEVAHTGVVVIVGANGSGKSRLGAWLENPASLRPDRAMAGIQARQAYRLGAQRVLSFPDQAQRLDPARAVAQLANGTEGPGSDFSRVQGDPVVGQANDFTLLVNTLFADRTRVDREYRELGVETGGQPGLPVKDTLQKLKRLWELIFSERKLVIGDHVVQAQASGGAVPYGASALSDGERVGFYLIGQALLAPNNALNRPGIVGGSFP